MKRLIKCDPAVALLLEQEEEAQKKQLNFIASENYAYESVLVTLGSVFTDTYAEGYPGKRYYAGCTTADAVEELAIKRCKELFDADHANVQPHSGSQANMAVFFSVLEPGDTLMGMCLVAGGHLTHGHHVNFSGKLYKSVQYTVNPKTEFIEYDAIQDLAHQHKPKLIIAGATSYSRSIDYKKFQEIAQSVGAYLMVDIAHAIGPIIAQLFPNPTPYADFITGTTHKALRGPRGGFILCKKEHKEKIDRSVFPGIQGGPHLNNIAAKAVTFYQASQPEFRSYIKRAVKSAKAMAREFEKRGYRVVSGGTDIPHFVLDLSSKGISGRDAEKLLEKADILVSRSAVPFDKQSPLNPSGIRLGTLAYTTQGFEEHQMEEIVAIIDKLLNNPTNETLFSDIKQVIHSITKQACKSTC